jgi:transitional endoplasmic reticulum ATPase
MMAKALATESSFNFLSVKGPELVSKWVGETEYNIREVFRKAREAAPAIIFFDEFDGLAKAKSGHDSLSPVKALLTELDGVQPLKGVFVVAATNRPELIDSSLLRPGRFDKILYSGPPNHEARVQILDMHTKKRHLEESVDLGRLAKRTKNWSGAELVALCNSAAGKAQKDFDRDKALNRMTEKHFELAFGDVKSQISEEVLTEYESWSASIAGLSKVQRNPV